MLYFLIAFIDDLRVIVFELHWYFYNYGNVLFLLDLYLNKLFHLDILSSCYLGYSL